MATHAIQPWSPEISGGHIVPHAWSGLLYSFARPLGIIAHAVMTIHAGIKAIPALSLGCYIRVANVTPSVHLTVLVIMLIITDAQLRCDTFNQRNRKHPNSAPVFCFCSQCITPSTAQHLTVGNSVSSRTTAYRHIPLDEESGTTPTDGGLFVEAYDVGCQGDSQRQTSGWA